MQRLALFDLDNTLVNRSAAFHAYAWTTRHEHAVSTVTTAPGWLATNAAPSAIHYLHPVMAHAAGRRLEFSPHWRCTLLLKLRDDQEFFSVLDIWPPSFEQLPETLDTETESAISHRLLQGNLPTQAQWVASNPGDDGE